ncbi:Tol biopolymer transport system, TolR protein [Bathymodiolus thermophilus thioautotrophic gill symbiont]|uniref:Cell division and transport-associated protein TolR n=1 Tax=Bathymodiolus thermophilus thioautotrophic gill symbiont TaxID=2360 RepID=A0A3G3IKJ1_9GAMM|nr:biopolymer transporter ExbD [Bathymodiolus thermophilus thioautotrophic gill symbiont]AYQ56357.1 Cell division and transport-associated protein TolR [Bathymodiolus thermophilus thioautotrophic gill symbiont]CAB5506214.1 Tol biopolymer transport system, TolR protein [Bathymodiolus thermophilus thioautotrophic gill symbiont]SGZ66952.1 Tol biopolymer transport system, TolR protein [Bathymodiolus thermophilus thioautotrophic gill symbiont]
MITLPKRSRANVDANINIVPYIDVMLVLLVIFMMTTPIIEQGIEVDLALMDDVDVLELTHIAPVIISMDKHGVLYIGASKIPATPEQVVAEIKVEMELNSNLKLKVLIRPDKGVKLEKYVELLKFIQKNTDIESVGMIGR